MNKTKISSRGQTVIPKEIRKRYGLREGIRVEWMPLGEDSFIARAPSAFKRKKRSDIDAIRKRIARYVKNADSVADIRRMRDQL